MRAPVLQRMLLALLPSIVVVSVGISAIWGDSGLLARHRLEVELREANAELAGVERENQRLLRDLQLMDEDPVVLERLVAEELGWGREDAVIVRFSDEGSLRGAPASRAGEGPGVEPSDGADRRHR